LSPERESVMSQLSMDKAAVTGILDTERALIRNGEVTRQRFVDERGQTWDIVTYVHLPAGELQWVVWKRHEDSASLRALVRGTLEEAGIETVADALDTARFAIGALT
jgi:hypothetical protein